MTDARPIPCPRCLTGRLFAEPASHWDGPGATDLVCVTCGHVVYDRPVDTSDPYRHGSRTPVGGGARVRSR